jgi:two-component system OmpR family response regulator
MIRTMKCLIVDDDAETRDFLMAALQQAGHTPVSCADAEQGWAQIEGAEWDVVVLDRMLPGDFDGLALLGRMRARGLRLPVLVLSALGDVDERVHGLRAGADDYLSKPFAAAELLARLENLVRRAAQPDDTLVLKVADLELDLRNLRVSRNGLRINLQPREFRLLEYLMRNAGKVVTRSMLLESVWEYHFDPQTNVIDVQISRLRGKVDKDADSPLIHTVRGEGYMLCHLAADGDA